MSQGVHDADVLLGFSGQHFSNERMGSVVPFSNTLVVVDRAERDELENVAVPNQMLAYLLGAWHLPDRTCAVRPVGGGMMLLGFGPLFRATRQTNFAAGVAALSAATIQQVHELFAKSGADPKLDPGAVANAGINACASSRRWKLKGNCRFR